MVLSNPLIYAIYGAKWPSAPLFLTLAVIGELLVLIGNIIYGRLLYATGETKLIMKLHALQLSIVAPLAFLLIPRFGILGLIMVGLVSSTPTAIIGLYLTWKRYETKADLQNSAKILLASTIAGAATYLFQATFVTAAWIMIVLGATLFLIVYIVSIPLIGAANQIDIDNLRAMFSGLGPVSQVLQLPLALVEALLKFRRISLKNEQK
jgi:O-antigen/teichoic acid export membrane protein